MLPWLKALWIPGALFLLLIAIGVAVPPNTLSGALPLKLDHSAILFGVYDPKQTLDGVPGIKLEHAFIDWNNPLRARLDEISRRAGRLGREVLLSVEPWARPEHDDPASYSKAILSGQYDDAIFEVCDGVAHMKGSVLIRWGQEMDAPNDRYPWNLDSPDYIAIYRYFVDKCRTRASNAQFVWSPRGDAGYDQYYPGDEYVNLVGLTLYGLEPWDVANYGHRRSFDEALAEKYEPATRIGKRIILAEFGVCGDAQYRQNWLSSALNSADRFPLLAGIVYFNDREPHLWPEIPNYDAEICEADSPDWRIAF